MTDELNQPTSFPGKFRSRIILALLVQIKNHENPQNPLGWAFSKKNPGFSEPGDK